MVLGAVLAAESVVRAHDPPGAALLDRPFERPEVDLAERAVVDLHVDRHPIHLGVVAGEVLDRDGDVLSTGRRARTPRRGRPTVRGPRCSTRTFARRPGCGGCSPSVRAGRGRPCAAPRCRATRRSARADRVPRRAQGDPGRHDHARRARSSVTLAAHPVGPVGHLHRRDPGVREFLRAPGGLAGEQPALVFQRERSQRRIGVDHARDPARHSRLRQGIGDPVLRFLVANVV